MWLLFIKTLFLTIVLPGVFVMARHECCREIETAIFAARTNLPVLDFQTWQVWVTPQHTPPTNGKATREPFASARLAAAGLSREF